MRSFEIAIIGAGASGLMVASKFKDRDIVVVENNLEIAKRVKISGGGRCNITNRDLTYRNYLGDREFVEEILDSFSRDDLITFLTKRGCKLELRSSGQYFCKDSSMEIVNLFKRELNGVEFLLGYRVLDLIKDSSFLIKTTRGDIRAKRVVVATGGLSYKKIGATPIAYEIAKKFGHTISRDLPALVGLTLQKEQFWMKGLSGVSIKVKVSTGSKEFVDNLLFTHRGISGPAILNISLYWMRGEIEIDFLPDFNLSTLLKGSKRLISRTLPLPKRFIKAFLKSVGLKDIAVNSLKESEIKRVLEIKKYTFAPAGNFGYERAEVTKGGILTSEIKKESMMSRFQKDLYFVGESLDVTGELGGYNLQWAFSSGWRVTL